MEILLKQDVPKLGTAGDIVTVKRGYARNYLLPRNFAMPVTPESRTLAAAIKERREREIREMQQSLEELAENLSGVSCTVLARANEDGKLFGSVTPEDVVDAFSKENFSVKPEWIILEDNIKALGVYAVKVRISSTLEAEAKVWVVEE